MEMGHLHVKGGYCCNIFLILLVFLLLSSQIPSMGDKCEISSNSAIEHNFPGPARLFQDKLDFSNVAE